MLIGTCNQIVVIMMQDIVGGKINDVQRQFDLTNNLDSNHEESSTQSETKILKMVTLLIVTMLLVNV